MACIPLTIHCKDLGDNVNNLRPAKGGSAIHCQLDATPFVIRLWEFWILANLDSASKVGCQVPPPPPLPVEMGIWDFSIFGLSIKSWLLTPCPPPPTPPSLQKWEFEILVFLDSFQFFGDW